MLVRTSAAAGAAGTLLRLRPSLWPCETPGAGADRRFLLRSVSNEDVLLLFPPVPTCHMQKRIAPPASFKLKKTPKTLRSGRAPAFAQAANAVARGCERDRIWFRGGAG